jgi:hypothetical protein
MRSPDPPLAQAAALHAGRARAASQQQQQRQWQQQRPAPVRAAGRGAASLATEPHGPNHWVAVASAEHVALGCAGGFMQVGHGKGKPLERLQPGDWIAYYSPVRRFGEKDACQAFTAVGIVRDGPVYQGNMEGKMGGGFRPWRRDVAFFPAAEAPIRPLLDKLSFTRGTSNWGYAFRFGLLKVEAGDMALVSQAMGVGWPAPVDAMPLALAGRR